VERLWTPWRREFIESAADEPPVDCFLCAMPELGDDRKALVVYRSERVFVILNRYPYNSGHVLVAPFAHAGDLAALDSTIAAELMHVTQRTVDTLTRVYRPHGFNVGMNIGRPAGAGVPDHLHMHIVPRWSGDVNFMPVLSDTKVLPETLDQTYDRLQPAFVRADGA